MVHSIIGRAGSSLAPLFFILLFCAAGPGGGPTQEGRDGCEQRETGCIPEERLINRERRLDSFIEASQLSVTLAVCGVAALIAAGIVVAFVLIYSPRDQKPAKPFDPDKERRQRRDEPLI